VNRLAPFLLALPLSLVGGVARAEAPRPKQNIIIVKNINVLTKGVREPKKKVSLRTQTEGGDSADVAAITLTDPGTGEVVFEGSASESRRSRVRTSGDHTPRIVDTEESTATLSVYAETDSRGRIDFDSLEIAVDADGNSAWVEQAHESGLKLRARVKNDRTRVVFMDEDGTWDPADVSGAGVRWTDADGAVLAGGALDVDDVVQRYVFDIGDLAGLSGDTLRIDATVQGTDAAGDVFTGALSTVEAAPGAAAGATDRIERVKLAQTRRGASKLVVFTSSDAAAGAAIEGRITDEGTGEDVLDVFDESPVKRVRVFESEAFEFEGGEDPGGFTYLMLADMYDNGGRLVGNQQEFEVSVDGIEMRPAVDWSDLALGTQIATFAFGGGLGEGALLADGNGGVIASTAWAGDEDVARIALTFEEPFEGPPPTVTEVETDLVLEANKWVVKASSGLQDGSTAGVTVNLVDAEGNVLDTVTTSGSSATGRVFENTSQDKYGDILIDGVPLIFD